jgi:hypothetical protein
LWFLPKSVSFPCLSPFRRLDLDFSPSTVKVIFLFAPFFSSALIPLDVLPEGSLGPKPLCFSLRMNAHLLCFSHHSLCFPQPTTSRPSPCSLKPQPWTQVTTFMEVYFGLETQATGGFSFQWWRSHMDFRSVACGYSESQNCTKYSKGKILKSRKKHEP